MQQSHSVRLASTSWMCRMCLSSLARRCRCRVRKSASLGTSISRRSLWRHRAASSRRVQRWTSGVDPFPKTCSNEAGCVVEVFGVARDFARLVVDFREPPDFEVLWRARDVIGALRVVDECCKAGQDDLVRVCREGLLKIVQQPIANGVQLHVVDASGLATGCGGVSLFVSCSGVKARISSVERSRRASGSLRRCVSRSRAV